MEVLSWARSPIFIALSQAMVVALAANAIAQMIRVVQTGVWTFSLAQFVRFFLLNAISLPLNHWWAIFLERKFPSYYEVPMQRQQVTIAKERPKSSASWELLPKYEEALGDASTPLLTPTRTPRSLSPTRPQRRLNVVNTAIKLLLDSFTVGVFCNMLITLSVLGFLKGYTGYEVLMDIEYSAIPTIVASYALYPPAAVIAYIWVPVEKRVIYSQFVGLIWGIYLSLVVGV